ncbi:MAG: hypothetical protein ACJAT2_002512 [Bacteriovoracaceae bacterium]
MLPYLFLAFFLNSLSLFAADLPSVSYPFDQEKTINCDQGAESPEGNSHTYKNTLYALDLASEKGSEPAGLYSSISGIVIAYSECIEHNSSCGAGFGNHLKILRSDGVLVFYAHLDSISVKTGEVVKVGQFLGIEGDTGLTGTDNRHLHFSVHRNWTLKGYDYYKKHLGSLPDSIPFKMNICQKAYGDCESKMMDIRKLKCKRVTKKTERVSRS